MGNNYEYRIFTEELKRLHLDYQRCNDMRIKREIYKDIELLEKTIEYIILNT